MKLRMSTTEKAHIAFANGRRVQISPDTTVEISDGGVLVLTTDDCQTQVFPPHAWTSIKKVDPAAMATRVLLSTGGVPDSPEALEK